jgi:hypothetical protein
MRFKSEITNSISENPNTHREQSCQMVYFQTKNPNLGKFWRALEWIMWVYFMTIWNTLWPFGIFSPFGYVWTKKNPATLSESRTRDLPILSQ